MVAAFGRHETVFTVLGESARRRSATSLAVQMTVSVVIGAAILVRTPQWWSVAFLAGWSAAYSAWGLVARVAESREEDQRYLSTLLKTIATLGTVLAITGIIGIGLAIYSGNAGGAKTTCGKNSTNKYCQAWKHPEKLTKLP